MNYLATNLGDGVVNSVTAGLTALLTFIPSLIGALLLLLIGWLIARVVATLVERLLNSMGFQHAMERVGVHSYLQRGDAKGWTASRIVGQVVFWFIFLVFALAAANALHVTAITALLTSIVLWIPALLVALLILALGVLLARFVASLVRGSLSRAGVGSASLMGSIVEFGIIALAVLVALNQIGISPNLIAILFGGVVFTLALALGLAFGLGGREMAGQLWQQWYTGGQQLATQIQKSGGASGDGGTPAASGDRDRVQTLATPTSSSRSESNGWRSTVSMKLREARAALPASSEASLVSRRLDDLLAVVERRQPTEPAQTPRYVS